MICIQCGAQNEDTISYCRQCGTNMQAVRSALLGLPPVPQQLLQPALNPRYTPFVFVISALLGFLAFGALFGAIIALIAIGSDPSSRIAADAVVFLAAFVAVTGTLGIVFTMRTLLKMVTAMSAAAPYQPPVDAGSRTLTSAPASAAVALPPPRQPASVVEHTTAHLPNYVSPGRNTGE